MRDLLASHISVALNERAAFKVEKLADLKLIVSSWVEQVSFHYLAHFHLLRAISAKPAEFVIFISKGSGRIAIYSRSERIGQTHSCVILGMGNEDRSFNALLIDNTAKEAFHAFRKSIM